MIDSNIVVFTIEAVGLGLLEKVHVSLTNKRQSDDRGNTVLLTF